MTTSKAPTHRVSEWLTEYARETHHIIHFLVGLLWDTQPELTSQCTRLYHAFILTSLIVLGVSVFLAFQIGTVPGFYPPPLPLLPPPQQPVAPSVYAMLPVRPLPDQFLRNAKKPDCREGHAALSISEVPFQASRDLVFFHDDRAWFESDHDQGDTEDDHVIHQAMELPMSRLVNMVHEAGGRLKIQDSFRASGIHSPSSLHKQGRAVDLTCDELSLETIAKFAWSAGFDWVYYEAPSRGGGTISTPP